MTGEGLKQKPALTLDAARRVVAAAEAEAKKNAWPVVIAVVDDGGHPVLLERLDEAQFGSIEIAIAKARAAVAFKRPTRVWGETLAGGRLAVLGLPGVLPSEGGMPIVVHGVIVGGIGVSGVRSDQDGQIAAAGLTALE